MTGFKLTMIQYLITALVSQLNETTVKKVLASAIGQVKKAVQSSETDMDDFIILPLLQAIEDALHLEA